MEYTIWFAFWCLVFGWFATVSGVILGGFLVFRTKRDSHEPFFPSKVSGEAFVMDEDFGGNEEPSTSPVSDTIDRVNKRFVDQFANNIGKRGEEGIDDGREG